jgi:ABC-type nitrate/sulfonate/bicarbonate transport system substrate-binding protein
MKALFHYNDYLKELQYISYFTTPRYATANRALISRFTRAVAQSQHWLNDSRNEKEATRIIIRHLKIDDTLATRAYRYVLTDGKAYRGEAKVDGPGLAEIIRMLAKANVIPQQEPWQSFVLE